MKRYTQLTQEQRHQIYALKKAGLSQCRIASLLGVHKSTISREIKRNCGQRGYRPKQAQRLSQQRRQSKHRSRITLETWQLIEAKLRLEWSPEQIAGWLHITGRPSVSHEWIYQFVLVDKRNGGNLYKHLRCQKQRKKRIEPRPVVVESRSRLGD